MKILLISLCLISVNLFGEAPWGKDASLSCRKGHSCPDKRPPNPLTHIGMMLVRFHQEVISPIDGPRSHYRPSSSQYTFDAMRQYGFFNGVVLGCDRLLRENREEWVYPTIIVGDGKAMKWDPVDGSCPPLPSQNH